MRDWDIVDWFMAALLLAFVGYTVMLLLSPSCADLGGKSENTGGYVMVGKVLVPLSECVGVTP